MGTYDAAHLKALQCSFSQQLLKRHHQTTVNPLILLRPLHHIALVEWLEVEPLQAHDTTREVTKLKHNLCCYLPTINTRDFVITANGSCLRKEVGCLQKGERERKREREREIVYQLPFRLLFITLRVQYSLLRFTQLYTLQGFVDAQELSLSQGITPMFEIQHLNGYTHVPHVQENSIMCTIIAYNIILVSFSQTRISIKPHFFLAGKCIFKELNNSNFNISLSLSLSLHMHKHAYIASQSLARCIQSAVKIYCILTTQTPTHTLLVIANKLTPTMYVCTSMAESMLKTHQDVVARQQQQQYYRATCATCAACLSRAYDPYRRDSYHGQIMNPTHVNIKECTLEVIADSSVQYV